MHGSSMLLTHHTDTLNTWLDSDNVSMALLQCECVTRSHGECDEPDGGKRGILLWRMIVY